MDCMASLGRPFLKIWAGQTASLIGSTMSAVAVAVVVYLETASEAWLGVIAAFTALPVVLMGPLAGVIDRVSRRGAMIAGDCIAAIGPLFALVLASVGRLEPWHLAAAGFISGAGSALQGPAAAAAVPQLVSPEVLDRANGLGQIGPAASIVLGPALATPLVVRFGIEAVLIVDLLSFVVAVAVTASTDFGARTVASSAGDELEDLTFAAAWTWLRSSGRPLLALMLVVAALNFGLAFFNVGLLAVATTVGGAEKAGLVLAAGGVVLMRR